MLYIARVVTDRATGYSKGFGFVNYANLEDAAKGIEGMDGKVSLFNTFFCSLWKTKAVALILLVKYSQPCSFELRKSCRFDFCWNITSFPCWTNCWTLEILCFLTSICSNEVYMSFIKGIIVLQNIFSGKHLSTRELVIVL